MKVKIVFVFFTLFALIIFYFGCTEKYEPTSNDFSSLEKTSCTHCHLDKNLLEEVAEPLPPDTSEASGEG